MGKVRIIIAAISLFITPGEVVAQESLCQNVSHNLEKAIKEANICDTAADCMRLEAPCPYCGTLVNKEYKVIPPYNIDNGLALLKECPVKCECPSSMPIKCIRNKCTY